MSRKPRPMPFEEEDDVVRCRRVRDEFNRRFKTVDAAFAHLQELEKKYGVTKPGQAIAHSILPKRQTGKRLSPPRTAAVHGGR